MKSHLHWLIGCLLTLAPLTVHAEPLVIGETFTLKSGVLDETRRINVYVPTKWGEPIEEPLPVLYMPDGGMGEDFLHIAGLLQVSVSNGTMRPFLLVGIRNTHRRRDLTGPTSVDEDKAIAPVVGGSADFRTFLKTELFPAIEGRYDVTGERAIIGESLAGYFIVETLLTEPAMFDSYIAFDPSLWWNDQALSKVPDEQLQALHGKRLFIAAGAEAGGSDVITNFIDRLRTLDDDTVDWHYQHLPDETHATIFHPAAMNAVRTMFAPPSEENDRHAD